MKRNTNTLAMKLVEKFDQQLHEILMSDLKAIRSARMNLINHLTFKKDNQERLMTA